MHGNVHVRFGRGSPGRVQLCWHLARRHTSLYGLHPIIVSVANTDEVLATLLRPGNAGSNTVADHIAVLREAIAQIPPRYRHRIIFRVDGAGATKDLLAWIKTEAAQHSYTWHYSVGFDVTEPVREAIVAVPANVWVPALTPEGQLRRGAQVTEITGLLTLADGWQPDQRTLARTEPLHPRYRKQASAIETQRGQRFQAIATDLPGHHYPRLDAPGSGDALLRRRPLRTVHATHRGTAG